MADVSNWVIEASSTVGQGDITLAGALPSFARFQDALPPGRVWYTIQDGANREAGTGLFDGVALLTRDDVRATLIGGTYNGNSPPPLNLSGAAAISCTFNSSAFVDFEDAPNLNLGIVTATALTATDITVTNTIDGDITGESGSTVSAQTVSAAAQPAITSLGILTGLEVTAPIAGDITGNAGSADVAGSATTAVTVSGAAQPSITSVGTLTALEVTAPIVGDITGNAATADSAGTAGSATTADTATSAGVVSNPAQPTITSVGTLTSLTVFALVGSGTRNVAADDNGQLVIAAGGGTDNLPNNAFLLARNNADTLDVGLIKLNTSDEIEFNAIPATFPNSLQVNGTLAGLGGIFGTLTGDVIGNADTSTTAGSASTAGSATTAGTVTTPAQPLITSVGTLTELTVASPIIGSVTGNAATASTAVTVTASAQPAITSVGTLLNLIVTNPIDGDITGSSGSTAFAATAGVVSTAAQPAITSVGTLTALTVTAPIAGSITGNAATATSATTAGSATTALTVTEAAQPNITSLGVLANLTVTNTINGSVTGSAGTAGTATSAGTAGTVTTAAQPVITSVGTLVSLAVANNITAGTDIQATGNIIAFSDSRLKDNQVVITGALDKLLTLSGYTYTRNDLDDRPDAGLIAQEVQLVLPEAVTETDSGILGLNYAPVIALMVETIKELNARIVELENR